MNAVSNITGNCRPISPSVPAVIDGGFEMVHEIRHCFYHSDHDAALRSFDLPKEQQRFTALPAEALNACAKEPERKPIVILHQERPVGFFVLHTGKRSNKSIPLYFAERNASLPNERQEILAFFVDRRPLNRRINRMTNTARRNRAPCKGRVRLSGAVLPL